jgi:hypothetical protein
MAIQRTKSPSGRIMAMTDEPCTICLLGPGTSGKSQLLAAMVNAVKHGQYGYWASFRLKMDFVNEKQREAAANGTLPQMILLGRRDDSIYGGRVTDAAKGELAGTASTRLESYEFTFSYRAKVQGDTQPFEDFTGSLKVIDAAGGHIFPEAAIDAEESGEGEAARRGLAEQVFQSTGLVIVQPFHRLQHERNLEGMQRLVDALAAASAAASNGASARPLPLRHVVIALHQYERLFMNFGAEAAELAFDPEIARRVIERAVVGLEWFEPLRRLDRTSDGPFDIRFIPTSAYGFLPGFGNPNIDPRVVGNDPFKKERWDPQADQPESEAAEQDAPAGDNEFHPFLAADPFVFAATGIGNDYMFGMNDLVAQPEPEPSAPQAASSADKPPSNANPDDARDGDDSPDVVPVLSKILRVFAQIFNS